MWKIWNDDVTIITDPFADIGYRVPKDETADIVLSSHDHFDHNNIGIIGGNPDIINKTGSFTTRGIKIETFPVWHDDEQGNSRGKNLLMKFILEGKNFLHCGDLGHLLNEKSFEQLGRIDVLFIPVGGFYTIDAKTAKKIVDELEPDIVFPMHYKTPALDFPITGKESYLELVDNVVELNNNQIELKAEYWQNKTLILNYE